MPPPFRTMLCFVVSATVFFSAHGQTLTPRYVSMAPYTGGYYECLPQNYDPQSNVVYPLILFIHGAGDVGNGSAEELPRLLKVGLTRQINIGGFPNSFQVGGQAFRFIIIAPQFLQMPERDKAMPAIESIFNYVLQHYKVDRHRMYMTGLSKGGGYTLEYAGSNAAAASRLAAIVTAAEASAPSYSIARTIAKANLPVWATHNLGDATIPVAYTTQYIDWINEAPAPVPPAKKTIFPGDGHDSWTQTYNPGFKENGLNIYEWMLQFKRELPEPPGSGISKVSIKPMPVRNTLTLSLEGADHGAVSIEIYNSTGLLVQQLSYQKTSGVLQQEIELSQLAAGFYLLKVQTANGAAASSFIKL